MTQTLLVRDFLQNLPNDKVACLLQHLNNYLPAYKQTADEIKSGGSSLGWSLDLGGYSDTKLMADIFMGKLTLTHAAENDEIVNAHIESMHPIYTDTNELTTHFVNIVPNQPIPAPSESSSNPGDDDDAPAYDVYQYTWTVGRTVEHYANGMDQPPTSTETVSRVLESPSTYFHTASSTLPTTTYNKNQRYFTVLDSLGIVGPDVDGSFPDSHPDPGLLLAEATPW